MINLNWVFEIKDWEKELAKKIEDYDDLRELLQILNRTSGAEAFVAINEAFLKTSIKPLEKPFNELKKVYVYQHRNYPVRKLARKLGVEETTIYAWLREFGVERGSAAKDNKTINMFE
ncbi:MAG: hypothetical protein Kow0098_03400 [Ignavibacteriaceae bacterium]